jgi:hypothetical protein
MTTLRLDNCAHCPCETLLSRYTRDSAIRDLERRELGCWNCIEADDGHGFCIQLIERDREGNDTVLWDGRCRPMAPSSRSSAPDSPLTVSRTRGKKRQEPEETISS